MVWCTGFADRNARVVAGAEVMDEEVATSSTLLRVDTEGEVRSMWKRYVLVENHCPGHARLYAVIPVALTDACAEDKGHS